LENEDMETLKEIVRKIGDGLLKWERISNEQGQKDRSPTRAA
jgi:hypothetical protein